MTKTTTPGVSCTPAELMSIALQPIGPRADPLAGEPFESVHRFYKDDHTVVGVWECTPGRFEVSKEGKHSIMYILAGRGTVTDANGTVHVLEPGAMIMEPDGWTGTWDVTETVRKVYVIAASGG